ncbi:MAG: hypothetical protein H0T11_04455, partial [Chthoniobacterales bacterium]|nr:hypothetical protein [Chthoniobacterales bacterium]
MAVTFFSPSRLDRTFATAVAVVALFGAVELIALVAHYTGRARVASPTGEPSVATTESTVAPAPSASVAAVPAASVAAPPAASVAAPPAATAAPATAGSTPATAATTQSSSPTDALLKEAKALRERGDTTNALARLQDAAQREPNNASVLAEMAMIYESIQLFDRSNETWRKIQQMGATAGPLYELAEMKLRLGGAQPTAQATAAPVAAPSEPGFAGLSPLDAGTTRGGVDGIPDGSTFGITEATVSNNPDPDAETNLTLRVGVQVRANTLIDHTKVKIQVYFYDTVDNNKVALTDAEVSYEWITPNHDWKSTNPEILAVSYVRLKHGAMSSDAALTEAAAAVTPP